MKKIFQHPPASIKGRAYWRSVEEYAGSPEFSAWLEREFPVGASELPGGGDEISRRNFMRLMGASLALAGFGLSGCSRPEAHVVPYTQSPEWQVLGKNLSYATAMPHRHGAQPLLVTTFNGRPTKIEGNPAHQCSFGKTSAHAQASILDLYDPDRLRSFIRKDGERHVESTKEEFLKYLEGLRSEWTADQGASLAILADETLSPTRERLREELQRQFPQMTWVTYEPLLSANEEQALEIAFGSPGLRLAPQYDKADVILAVDSDFLGSDAASLKDTRDFTQRRKVEKPGDPMNRLYVVENRYTVTGASADHRIRMPVQDMEYFLSNLLYALFQDDTSPASSTGTPRSVARLLPSHFIPYPLPNASPDIQKSIDALAADLLSHPQKALVVVGSHQSIRAQLLGLAINELLGSVGNTLLVQRSFRTSTKSIESLTRQVRRNKVSTLVILEGNAAYNAPFFPRFEYSPDLAADNRIYPPTYWSELQKNIPHCIHLTYAANETSELATWQVPAAHYLESWGDALAADGSYLSIQPMIEPFFGGLSQIELLARMAGQADSQGINLVQQTVRTRLGDMAKAGAFTKEQPPFEAVWEKLLQEGRHGLFAAYPLAGPKYNFNVQNVSSIFAQTPLDNTDWRKDFIEIVFAADYSMDDGRYNNNAWMQEFPDPITKLTWDNAALISPATAQKLGLSSTSINGIITADMISIEVPRLESLEAWVLVAPGHADNSITLPLGYGRKVTGRVGEGSGFNPYPLRTVSNPYFTNAIIKPLGKKRQLAVTQEHFSMEGRDLIREAPLEHFNKYPEFAQKMGPEAHSPPIQPFYNTPPLDAPHQWAMTIDLNACTGCNACVIACQSENNIPVVGKDQVMRGREMHWIRIDRYFANDSDYNQDKNELPADPQVLMQPVTCMQCENAPCETVCPVNATVHSEEGLNIMAYNRCIGTRYCANNCPYKVRRFNFFDYNQRPKDYAKVSKLGPINSGKLYQGPLQPKGMEEISKLQKNPNVTIRMRGVMEKCTFCVQRLEGAKIDQKIRAGASNDIVVRDGAVQVACQQACPADAIVFGNKKDPNSRVAKTLESSRRYQLLAYLDTQPRITYLARLRNPNPQMPGAEKIGAYLLSREHAHTDMSGHGNAPSSHPAHQKEPAAAATPGDHHP